MPRGRPARATVVLPEVREDPETAERDEYEPAGDEMTEIETDQAKLGGIAMFNDPAFQDYEWSVYRYRTKDEMAVDPHGAVREFVMKRIGPLEPADLQAQLGGGTFDLFGYLDKKDGNGKRLRFKPKITFAGRRLRYDDNESKRETPASPQPQPNGSDTLIATLLDRMDRRLERLEQQPAPPPPPPPQPLKDLTSALVDLDQLRKGGESNHGPEPRELVSDYLETLKTGIEIGQKRDPLPAGEQGTDWIKLIETSGIILDRLLQCYG